MRRLPAFLLILSTAACDRDISQVAIPAVARIEIQDVSIIGLGHTMTLTATAYDSAGAVIPNAPVTWISRDTMSLHLTPSGSATGRNWSKKAWVVAQQGSARDSIAVITAERYNVTDIGTLGGPEAEGLAVSGDYVVGWSTTSTGARHAFRWQRGGGMIDLGTLGGITSTAYDVNAAGVVVGEAGYTMADSRLAHAFVVRNGVMIDLGTLGGSNSSAYAVTADGTRIVGAADSIRSNCANPIVCSEYATTAAALWVNDVVQPLAANTRNPYSVINLGAPGGWAYDISGALIVGSHNNASVFWDLAGTAHTIAEPFFLPATPRSEGTSTAWRVAADGSMIGWNRTIQHSSTSVEGWLRRGASSSPLIERVGDYEYTKPLGINAAGHIVGESGSNLLPLVPSCGCGVVWRNSHRFDLNLLANTALHITVAHAIDDQGNIVATGVTPDGRKRALLLEPVR